MLFEKRFFAMVVFCWACPLLGQPQVISVPWETAIPQRYGMTPSGNLWVAVNNHIFFQTKPSGVFTHAGLLEAQQMIWAYRSVRGSILRISSFWPEDGKTYLGQSRNIDSMVPVKYWDMLTEVSASGVKLLCDEKTYTFDGITGTKATIGDLVGPWPSGGLLYMAAIKGGSSTIYSVSKGSCNLFSVMTLPFQVVQFWKMGTVYLVERAVLVDTLNSITDVVQVGSDGNFFTIASPIFSAGLKLLGKPNNTCSMVADSPNQTALIACDGADGNSHALFWKDGKVTEVYNSASDGLIVNHMRALAISKDHVLFGGSPDQQFQNIKTVLAKNLLSNKQTVVARVGDEFEGFKPRAFSEFLVGISQKGVVYLSISNNTPNQHKTVFYETERLDPPTVTFTVDKTIISPGDQAKLAWTTERAEVVTIDQGIGPVPASGTRVVTPTQTTSYILSASNVSGMITIGATVAVVLPSIPPPRINTTKDKLPDRPRRRYGRFSQ